jgi:glycosyltransferase involved in cell wall biosynthesis
MFLCVGSIEPRKNHLSILRAAENCWANGLKFELILAGGQGWSNEEVIEFCIDLKERGRALKIINDASDPSLLELYSEAFAFITIPWVEGFGLPLAEAISTGKPTIASDITSHREFGCVENVFFVTPDDINGISNAMAQLLEAKKREMFVKVTPRPALSWENYAHQLIVSIKD